MKKIIYPLLLVACLTMQLHAQSRQEIKKIEAGQNLEQYVSSELLYIFEDFEDGAIVYNNGAGSRGKLNYNLLIGEMQFIDPVTNEILSLANVREVSAVSIAKRFFVPFHIYNGEFMEVLAEGTNWLAVKRKTIAIPYGKEGPYGAVFANSSIESVQNISHSGMQYNIPVSNYQSISSQKLYYLVYNGKETLVKNEKSILNTYPRSQRPIIEQFIKDNNIDTKEEADLVRLIHFCNQL